MIVAGVGISVATVATELNKGIVGDSEVLAAAERRERGRERERETERERERQRERDERVFGMQYSY